VICRFGDFEVSPATYELRRSGERVHLEPRVFEVLAYLLDHRDRVVSKDELLARLWPGQSVSESALTRAVRDVRRALGDTGTRERWIQTVHGRGYRFAGQVSADASRLGGAGTTRDEATSDERRRGGGQTHDLRAYQLYVQGRFTFGRYTAEGIRKAIHYFEQAIGIDPGFAMAHVGLARAYAELANEGVGPLWPETAFARAAEAVARALALDPELGEAHGIVALLAFSRDYDWTTAEREFRKALELAPGCADVYDHYGWMCLALERHEQAIDLFRRARELDPLAHPTDIVAALLRAGRHAEALEAAERVIEFDPTIARGHSLRGWTLLLTGREREGLTALEAAVSISPESTLFRAQLGQAYALVGRVEEARRMLDALLEIEGQRYVSPYHLAYLYTGLGDDEAAIDCLERAFAQRAPGIAVVKGSFLFASLRSHPRFLTLLHRMNIA
jgi:DNA-binding winged helix-turn-helix (wHTH) protein/Flp pilus assembly protein TadD